MNRNIGVILPTEWELPTAFKMKGCYPGKKEVSSFDFFGNNYFVVFSGWGIRGRVAESIKRLQKYEGNLDAFILIGFCSDLQNRLNLGDIVIADSVSNKEGSVLDINNSEVARMLEIAKCSPQRYHFGQIHSLPYTAVESLRLPGLAVDEESYDAAFECKETNKPLLIAKTVVKNLPVRSLRKKYEGSHSTGEIICGLPAMIGIKIMQPTYQAALSKFFIDFSMYYDGFKYIKPGTYSRFRI